MAKQPTDGTIKALFSRTPRCAFSGCPILAIDAATNTPLLQVCHIKGDKEGTARYDAEQSDDVRQGYGNLVLMCGTHHKIIDDNEDDYPLELLLPMKKVAERREAPIQPNQGVIEQALLAAKVASLEQEARELREEREAEIEHGERAFELVELHTQGWNLLQGGGGYVLNEQRYGVKAGDARREELDALAKDIAGIQRMLLQIDGWKLVLENEGTFDRVRVDQARHEIVRVRERLDAYRARRKEGR